MQASIMHQALLLASPQSNRIHVILPILYMTTLDDKVKNISGIQTQVPLLYTSPCLLKASHRFLPSFVHSALVVQGVSELKCSLMC